MILEAYKGIKDQLKGVAPVFWFNGQYKKTKQNISLRLPAIFIETKTQLSLVSFGRIYADKNFWIKIHLVTKAPFQAFDNTVQDNCLQNHETLLNQIRLIMEDLEIRDSNNALICSSMIADDPDLYNFQEDKCYSVLSYNCEAYDYLHVPDMVKATPKLMVEIRS